MSDHSEEGARVPSRRERLRAETSDEIRTIALKLMATGGPDAITLRAIAREMGMTAGAIYGYFATRDDLITTLIKDVHTSLVDTLEAARDAHPEGETAERVLAWAAAFRDWALANPEGFRLIYGDPVPGYVAPEGGPAPEAEHRTCAALTGLVAEAWSQAGPLQPPDTYTWSDFDDHLVEVAERDYKGLPPAGLALALRVWGRVHGMISLEIYGHMRGQTRAPDKVFRSEVFGLIASLGLTPPRT